MKVSKKGQVVIPAEYRERLGIEPGDEVTVRIRGQFLLIELDTDIEADIEFLENFSGKLGEENFDLKSVEEIIRDLLEQQFYSGNDVLTDRVNDVKITIRGTDHIINETIKVMANVSRRWLNGDYVDTIRGLSEALDLDFPALLSSFVKKLNSMLPGGDLEMVKQMGGEVIFSMVISSTLTQFRERIGDEVTEFLYKKAKERGYVKRLGNDTVEDRVTRDLAEKYSILMNLRTLRELARTNVKSTGERHFKEISKKMLEKFSDMNTPDHVVRRKKRTLRRRIQRAKDEGREYTREEFEEELGLDLIKNNKMKKETDEEEETKADDTEEAEMPDMPSMDF